MYFLSSSMGADVLLGVCRSFGFSLRVPSILLEVTITIQKHSRFKVADFFFLSRTKNVASLFIFFCHIFCLT